MASDKRWYNPGILRPHRMRNTSSGGAAAWTPLQLPSLIAWYSASRSSMTKSGSAISQWNDISGNNRHLTQTTAADQPTYEATGLNGHPTVYCNSDWMKFEGNPATNYPRFTVWMVLKPITNLNFSIIWYGPQTRWVSGGTGDLFAEVRNGSTTEMDMWSSFIGASTGSGAGSFSTGSVYRLLTTYDTATATQYINNVSKIVQSASSRQIGDFWTFASYRAGGFTQYDTECRVSEMIVCTTDIGSTDRTNLESWYTSEWA